MNLQAVKHHCRVPADREIMIQLPADAVVGTIAEVIVLYQNTPDDDDDAEMAMAANDPLFMADCLEVMEDFKFV